MVLLQLDQDLADKARAGRCLLCEGRLDSAIYPRKPRGAPELPVGYGSRFSFCCDDCKKRHTPMSIRYLGRKVYLGAVVVLASAMRCGVTATRAARLRELFGVSERTLDRWRSWWQGAFAQSPFWKVARGLLAVAVDETELPLSLLELFSGDEETRLLSTLKLLAPITTRTGAGSMAF